MIYYHCNYTTSARTHIYGTPQLPYIFLIWTAKKCLRTCADSDHPAHAGNIIFGPLLSIHSLVSNDSVRRQWKPWSDCADAHDDLGLRCPHMLEDMFSHLAVHMSFHMICEHAPPQFPRFTRWMWLDCLRSDKWSIFYGCLQSQK